MTGSERWARGRELLTEGGPKHALGTALRHGCVLLTGVEEAPQELPYVVRACDFAARGPWSPTAPLAWPPKSVAFVIPAYATGAGGHANIFRVARELAAEGITTRIAVSDTDRYPLVQQQPLIAPVVGPDVEVHLWSELPETDVLVATAWRTAYDVFAHEGTAHKAYLVQDLESSFTSAGSLSLAAALTYRFGFSTVTLGTWLRDELATRYGVDAQSIDFGFDGSVYHLTDPPQERSGVVFYGRSSTPRRCVELGIAALTELHARHPDVPITVIGGSAKLPFPARELGVLTPAQLAELFQRTATALVLSASNVSLLPLELMACGVLPVVNEEYPIPEGPRQVACEAPSLPRALAGALSDVLQGPRAAPAEIAASVADRDYGRLVGQFTTALEKVTRR